jgi:hypothetical protein
MPGDKFTFVIKHEMFPTSGIDPVALSQTVCKQLQVDALQEDLSFVISKSAHLFFLLFMVFFQE